MPRETVLFVEDEEDIREWVSATLEGSGCTVRQAASGQEALDILETEIPGAIVLDRALPDIDGLTLLQQIHSIPVLERIPVIMLSASADGINYKALGLFDCIGKPCEPQFLSDIVQKALTLHLGELK